jgi:hypothetical protein
MLDHILVVDQELTVFSTHLFLLIYAKTLLSSIQTCMAESSNDIPFAYKLLSG